MAIKKKIRPLSEKKRISIINQAAKLFLNKGFGAISMDEISLAAGVSKRTLYNHFPTKKILFCEIVKIEWRKIKYQKIHNPHIHSPEDIFTAIMRHILKIMYSVRMQNLLRLVIAESAQFPELKKLQAEYGVEPLVNDFSAYIESLNKNGYLNVANPRIAAGQYIGLVKECLYWPWLLGVISKPAEKHQNEIIRQANKIFFSYYKIK
jgi:TetR/AcrR family transcriptional regulator of autoinduction and epiphytic fitness